MEGYEIELVLVALLAISEVLALSPLKSNSIFQLVRSLLGAITVKKDEEKKEE